MPARAVTSSPYRYKEEGSSVWRRSEEHTSVLQSQSNLVCRLLLEKKKKKHCRRRRELAQLLSQIGGAELRRFQRNDDARSTFGVPLLRPGLVGSVARVHGRH